MVQCRDCAVSDTAAAPDHRVAQTIAYVRRCFPHGYIRRQLFEQRMTQIHIALSRKRLSIKLARITFVHPPTDPLRIITRHRFATFPHPTACVQATCSSSPPHRQRTCTQAPSRVAKILLRCSTAPLIPMELRSRPRSEMCLARTPTTPHAS